MITTIQVQRGGGRNTALNLGQLPPTLDSDPTSKKLSSTGAFLAAG